ncbi:hypothetical protein ScPMuIL_016115 [Solemya velum]
MDVQDLFTSCRRGDLHSVQYLVEQKEMSLNVRDKWDSTPLYYACLCGHLDVVAYMLESGVKCEPNTFDGERCLYGAFDDDVRHLLRKYKVLSSSPLRRDLYEEFLGRLLKKGMYDDVFFHIHDSVFSAHKCILSARCPRFAELFQERWKGRKDIHLTHKLVRPWEVEIEVEYIPDVIKLAKYCRLPRLVKLIEEKLLQSKSFQYTKPGFHITTLVVEQPVHSKELQLHLGRLADLALPPELYTFVSIEFPVYADICFSVQHHDFYCHQVFFCGRSDYFKALLVDHFGEKDVTNDNIQIVTLNDVSADTFMQVMYYLYQDSCELTEENVYGVLWAAEMYFLPGLKRQCGIIISRYINVENVTSLVRLARMFSLPALENHCAEFIVNNLNTVIQQEDFCSLVKEDAKIWVREELTIAVTSLMMFASISLVSCRHSVI